MGLIGKIPLPEITEDQRILTGYKVLVLVQLGWLRTRNSGAALGGRAIEMGQKVFETAMGFGCV